MKKTLISVAIIVVTIITGDIVWQKFFRPAPKQIVNFEECAALGNPVMESYPRQCRMNGQTFVEEIKNLPDASAKMTEAEARVIAEKTCIKGGESLALGYYNAGTKTWWFDANLNAATPGCNPACVVSEDTKLAEINWRCTGLKEANCPPGCPVYAPPVPGWCADADILAPLKDDCGCYGPPRCSTITKQAIQKLFAAKYPKYAPTVTVKVEKEITDFASGSVRFADATAGGLWFAAKTANGWELAFDGNGMIPCAATDKYGIPREMVPQCIDSGNNNNLIQR